MTATRPLVRPGFAKASAIIFVLLLPAVAHAVWDYVEARRLRTRIDAIAARGEPLTMRPTKIVETSEGARKSASYYRAAVALAGGVYEEMPSTLSRRMMVAARAGAWPPDLIPVMRAQVDRYAEALAFADRAAALPFDGFDPDPGMRYDLSTGPLLTVAQLCEWRAIVRAMDGDGDGAAESLYSEARLARALPRFLPSFRSLPFVLEHAPPSSAAGARLAEALAPLDRDDRVKQQFIEARGYLLDDWRSDRAAWSSPARTLRIHRLVRLLDKYEQLLRAAELPWPQPMDAVPALGLPPSRQMTTIDRAGLQARVNFAMRTTKAIRCARLHVDGATLKLVDPFTGRFLTLADCKL
jgi:hypothetical protein